MRHRTSTITVLWRHNCTFIAHLQKGVVFTPTPFTMAQTMAQTMAIQFHPYHPFAKGCGVYTNPFYDGTNNGTTMATQFHPYHPFAKGCGVYTNPFYDGTNNGNTVPPLSPICKRVWCLHQPLLRWHKQWHNKVV